MPETWALIIFDYISNVKRIRNNVMKKLLDCIEKELSPKRSSKTTGKDLVEIEVLSYEKHKYEISNWLTFMSWCRKNVCMYVCTYIGTFVYTYVCMQTF